MFDRPRSTLRTAVICGFLLLAFSVFAWGLHAKLSLYQHQSPPSSATVAKLILSPRSDRALVAAPDLNASTKTPIVWQLTLSFVAALLLLPSLKVRRLTPHPVRTRLQNHPFPPHRFSRPPPPRRRAL